MKEIKLWKNRKELSNKVALVDDEDYNRVMKAISSRARWYAHSSPKGSKFYAVNGSRDLAIHRVITNAPKGMDVDHINGNPLDNRKENLRICTRSENCRNKKVRSDSATGYKGVEKPNSNLRKPFRAYIGDPTRPGVHLYLGHHVSASEAAKAYDKKALELYGEFALLNFPRG
jgi:hypothetical protein